MCMYMRNISQGLEITCTPVFTLLLPYAHALWISGFQFKELTSCSSFNRVYCFFLDQKMEKLALCGQWFPCIQYVSLGRGILGTTLQSTWPPAPIDDSLTQSVWASWDTWSILYEFCWVFFVREEGASRVVIVLASFFLLL